MDFFCCFFSCWLEKQETCLVFFWLLKKSSVIINLRRTNLVPNKKLAKKRKVARCWKTLGVGLCRLWLTRKSFSAVRCLGGFGWFRLGKYKIHKKKIKFTLNFSKFGKEMFWLNFFSIVRKYIFLSSLNSTKTRLWFLNN